MKWKRRWHRPTSITKLKSNRMVQRSSVYKRRLKCTGDDNMREPGRPFTFSCCKLVPVWTAGWRGTGATWRLLAVMAVVWADGRRPARILADRRHTWRWWVCHPERCKSNRPLRSRPTGWGLGPVARNRSPGPGYRFRFRIC